MRKRLVIGALFLGVSPSFSANTPAPDAPRYDDRSLVLDLRLRQWTDKSLRANVRDAMKGSVDRLERRTSEGHRSPVKLGELSTAELMAVLVSIRFDLEGSEKDLLAQDFRERLTPVSVWWDKPGVLTLQSGEPWKRGRHPTTTRKALTDRFDMVQLVDGDRAWEPESLALIQEAVARLTPTERERLRDVPFHRKRAPSKALIRSLDATPGAVYTQDDRGPRLEIYDSAISVSNRFIGTPEDPHPYSLFVLLHEMGHAIARAEVRHARREIDALIAEQALLVDASKVEFARLNRARTRIRSRAEGARYERDLAAFEAKRKENDALVKRIETRAADLRDRIGQPSAAARGLARVLGRRGPPTWYGLSEPDEAFADTFALFHADPAALERTRPKALKWFEAGGHLSAGPD